jgi:hypothetical protein
MEEALKLLSVRIAAGTEAAAAVIIGAAVIQATLRAAYCFVRTTTALHQNTELSLAPGIRGCCPTMGTSKLPSLAKEGSLVQVVVIESVQKPSEN